MLIPLQGSTLTLGTHITFRDNGNVRGGKEYKTSTFDVLEKNTPNILGTIYWFAHWRKYIFAPNGGTLYEETCMREISEFIEAYTKAQFADAKERRERKKAVKP